ncbi:MAG: MurR/RpiR family transcriptional regulator [Candidatus Fimivivens sp.]
MDQLKSKIAQTSLTKTEKLVADYMLENMDTIGLFTITDLASAIGVSDTSIVRFVRSLGFQSFSAFKKHMNARILNHYNNAMTPKEKLIKTKSVINESSLAFDIMQRSVENIKKAHAQLDPKVIAQTTEILLNSKNKFIAGFRTSSCCTTYFSRKLAYLLNNVRPLVWAESATVEQLVDMTQDDCLLLYSFPPNSEITYLMLEMAKKIHAKTILITDKITSPLSSQADIVIPVPVDGLGSTFSYLAPLYVTETLLLTISNKKTNIDDQRAQMLDAFINKGNLY